MKKLMIREMQEMQNYSKKVVKVIYLINNNRN